MAIELFTLPNCPGCRQVVRVPRGKGKINIRCPKCNRQFIKKT